MLVAGVSFVWGGSWVVGVGVGKVGGVSAGIVHGWLSKGGPLLGSGQQVVGGDGGGEGCQRTAAMGDRQSFLPHIIFSFNPV